MYKQGLGLVVLRGNVTRDPEMKYTPNGIARTSFSVALNESWKSKEGALNEHVSFIPCVAWGPLGERVAEFVRKGQEVSIQGTLRQERFEQDGKNVSYINVVASRVDFGDKAKDKDAALVESEDSTSEEAPF